MARNGSIEEEVKRSFQQGEFRWRTASSISRDIGTDVDSVTAYLENSGLTIRARKPNKRGLALYALREKIDRSTPLLQRFLAKAANEPD